MARSIALVSCLAVAALSASAAVQSPVRIRFDAAGLTSVAFEGNELLQDGTFRVNNIQVRDDSGGTHPLSLSGTTRVDTDNSQVIHSYGWGDVAITYRALGNRLDLTMAVTNRSGTPIEGVFLEPLALRLPARPDEYDGNTPIIAYDSGEPGVLSLTSPSMTVVMAVEDPGAALIAGFPFASDRPTSTVFPLRINTSRDPSYPDSYPYVDRPIAPGTTDQYRVSLRFGSAGSVAASLAADVYHNFQTTFPAQLNWPDHRPIGQLVIATSATGWPTNPRGWLLDSSIDVTTPEGRAQFRSRILAWADASVAVLKRLDAQGMITWDIEGEQFTHPTTYLCDPAVTSRSAPEMDAIADEYFRRFRDAGLRVGVCVRPQTLVFSGTSASQQPSADPAQVLINKIAYAKARWQASIFYIDSNGGPGLPMDAGIIQRVLAAHPDVLLVPEHENTRYYAYSAPYRELRQQQVATPASVRLTYPSAFGVTYMADGDAGRYFDNLVSAVRAGDVLMTRGWFDDPVNATVSDIYARARSSSPPPPPPPPSPVPDPPPPPPPQPPSPMPQPIPDPGTPAGMFMGSYFNALDFQELFANRLDSVIDFDWGDGPPMPGMRSQTYTIRWQGQFDFPGGAYEFVLRLDDGARLYIDGERVWDVWGEHWEETYRRVIPVATGTHVVRLDYVQFSGKASVGLSWSPVSSGFQTSASKH